MIGKCVQIGLNSTAEYLPLIYSEWKMHCEHRSDLAMLPSVFPDISEWEYYGVDSAAFSISYLANKFTDIPRTSWICAHVVGKEKEKLVRQQFDDGLLGKIYPTFTSTVTLDDLFSYIGGCDLLVMDIEGAEYEVVYNSDWKVKPRYMLVETHGTDGGNGDIGSDENYPARSLELISYFRRSGYASKLVYVNPKADDQAFVEARWTGDVCERKEVPLDETH